MEAQDLLVLGALGIGGYYIVSGGTSKKSKNKVSPVPMINFPDLGNLGKGSVPALNIQTPDFGGQINDIQDSIAQAFGQISGSATKNLIPSPMGIPDSISNFNDKMSSVTKDIVSTPRRIAESEGKAVAQDIKTIGNKAIDIGARGLPLGTIGLATGGPIGGAVGVAGGNLLYNLGERIGKATSDFGKWAIKSTGGTESPIFKIGQSTNRIFNNEQYQKNKKALKKIKSKDTQVNNTGGGGSDLNKTTSKDKKGKTSVKEKTKRKLRKDVSYKEHQELKDKLFKRWA